MIWFLLRRFGLLLAALLVASVIIFSLLRLLPGDLAATIGGIDALRRPWANSASVRLRPLDRAVRM